MKQSGFWNIIFGFLLILLAVLAAAFLLPAWYSYREERLKEVQLQAKLDQAKLEEERLNIQVLKLQNSPEAIEKVAREKYNYVKPGETVLNYDVPGKK